MQLDSYPITDRQYVSGTETKLTEEKNTDFWRYFKNIFGESPTHQMLGNPKVEQNEPRIEVDFHVHGLLMHGDELKNWQAHVDEIPRWQLLFQFDSDEELNAQWCDCGLIYFLIRREDLTAHSWEKTWLILQSG